jgi:predicted GNAT family N-acyltransferase
MKKALEYAKSEGVYKITLTCREHLVPFYERFDFEKYSIQMKQYIEK